MGRKRSGVRAVSASSIEISFQYQGQRCRERIPLEPTPANLKKAELHKAAIEHAIMLGTFDYTSTFPKSKNAQRFRSAIDQTPVARYLPEWLERARRSTKSSTWDDYRTMVNGPLTRMFGNYTLGELDRFVITEQLAQLDVSNKRLANLQSCLRIALEEAVDLRLLTSNPLAGWTYRIKERRDLEPGNDKIDPFSPEEEAAILAAMPEQLANFFRFAFWTGLRTSELVALEWTDVDWVHKQVHVSRALTQQAAKPETPKTRASQRRVKLLQPALQALIRQKKHSFLAGEQVFLDPRYGTPFTGDQALRKSFWVVALKKAGVRYRNPYQTRHTYASRMLTAGEHPMWVASQMGHSDWTMIARVYGKYIPPENLGEGSKAEALFNKQEPCQSDLDSIETTSPRKPLI